MLEPFVIFLMSDSMEICEMTTTIFTEEQIEITNCEHGYKLYTLSLKKKKRDKKGHPLGNLHELVNNTYATLSLGFLTHLF